MLSHDTRRPYTLFGRRKGRPLNVEKSRLMETLLPQIQIATEGAIDLTTLFPGKQEFWLEVGFGGGEHLATHASSNPSVGLIGCEPFVNGVASLLEHVSANNLTNVRIYPDDARMLLDRLPENSLSKCFVMFPDPWPKKRHAPRRFIGPDNLPKLARAMKPGAEIRIASDEPPLQDWMLDQMLGSPDFVPAPGTEQGIYSTRPVDWPETRYEKKALAKKKYANWRGPRYFSFLRKA